MFIHEALYHKLQEMQGRESNSWEEEESALSSFLEAEWLKKSSHRVVSFLETDSQQVMQKEQLLLLTSLDDTKMHSVVSVCGFRVREQILLLCIN